MKKLFALFGIVAFVSAAVPVCAQSLVDAEWLSQHLNDRNLVILNVDDVAGFAKGHIPKARNITLASVSRPGSVPGPGPHDMANTLMFEVPDADVLKSSFEAVGVSDDSRIVLYANSHETMLSVTRVALILGYVGLGEQTSILNGGLRAWTAASHATTTDTPAVARGHFTPKVNPELIVDASFVKALPQKAHYKLIDARAPVYYKGTEPTYGKEGHIAGAINIPFSGLHDDKQVYDPAHFAQVFKEAGIEPGDKLVVYCHIGLQATEVIFAARTLGYQASLYDGAFQDWATHNRGAVEK